jgi:hypothetical protein
VAVGAAAVVVEVGRPRPAKNRRDTQRPPTWRANCRGSITADSKFLRLRVGPRTVAQTGGTHDLYWFGPSESNTLRSVRATVLFALICSRGYKWAREGQVPKSL